MFISLAGLIIIFLITPDISPQYIVLEGEITGVDDLGSVSFIDFFPYDFTVLSFDSVNKTGRAKLVGKLASYDGKVEFIVDEVR